MNCIITGWSIRLKCDLIICTKCPLWLEGLHGQESNNKKLDKERFVKDTIPGVYIPKKKTERLL
jgi:hypothetical protein